MFLQDFKATAAYKAVFDRRPLNFTDQCDDDDLIDAPSTHKYLENCPKGDSCLRFTFRNTEKGCTNNLAAGQLTLSLYNCVTTSDCLDYDAVVRGCTQRILTQHMADLVGVEELGCHEFSEEEFGTAVLCTCKDADGCNRDGAASLTFAPLSVALLVGLGFMMRL